MCSSLRFALAQLGALTYASLFYERVDAQRGLRGQGLPTCAHQSSLLIETQTLAQRWLAATSPQP